MVGLAVPHGHGSGPPSIPSTLCLSQQMLRGLPGTLTDTELKRPGLGQRAAYLLLSFLSADHVWRANLETTVHPGSSLLILLDEGKERKERREKIAWTKHQGKGQFLDP